MKRLKIRLNFFQKLMLYSISVTLICMTMLFFLNQTLVDKFYVYRKTIEIPLIAKEIRNLRENPEKLQTYIENEVYENGVFITFGNSGHMPRGREFGLPNSPKLPSYERINRQNKVELKSTKIGRRYLAYKEMIDGIPLYITLPLVSMENYKYETWIIGFISIMVALIASIILGRFFSKKLTRNIEKLNYGAKKIADFEFIEKLNIDSGDEIGELAHSVEEMSQNLKSSIHSLKNFVSNASHELKTPISIINLTSQNLLSGEIKEENDRKKAYKVLVRETNEMSELINNLMTLSKINYEKKNLNMEILNLKKLVKTSLLKYEFFEFKNDLEVELDIPSEYKIFSDIPLFKIVIDNLIQNALKYSLYGGKVEIFLKEDTLYLKNQLKEKIEERAETLLDPFSRGSNAAGGEIEGSGLGLSIVKSILEILGMKYSLGIFSDMFIFKIELKKCVWSEIK